MPSSDRPGSRVVRGGDWQPLALSRLGAGPRVASGVSAGGSGSAGGRAATAGRPPDEQARLAAAFRDGVAEGRRLAAADAERIDREAGADAQGRWERLTAALEASLGALEAGLADRVLDLSLRLAEAIACRAIVTDVDAIVGVLDTALRELTSRYRRLEIVAHPSEVERVRAWADARGGDAAVTVRGDPSIAPGGCRIAADDAQLDATVATRIRRAFAALGAEPPDAATGSADTTAQPVALAG